MTEGQGEIRNPFSIGITTELLEEPSEFKRAFSEQILVSETRPVFQPINVVVTGPQGTGKSMILNLLRYKMLNEFLPFDSSFPSSLAKTSPFLGISVNLTRANFFAFGRHSIAEAIGSTDQSLDIDCAADYLAHYLFREFVGGLEFMFSSIGNNLREWMGVPDNADISAIAQKMSTWDCWSNYYHECTTLNDLASQIDRRLNLWRTFLAGGRKFPREILESIVPMHTPIALMGELLRSIDTRKKASLYVIIDQYEELIGLNKMHGTELQRIINSLIKTREHQVFYKMGVRTYDWGTELRVLGGDTKIQMLRDYVHIDLADLLVRTERMGIKHAESDGKSSWLFPRLAEDVAVRRIQTEGRLDVSRDDIRKMFGEWSANEEAAFYLKRNQYKSYISRSRLPIKIQEALVEISSLKMGPLDVHLAIAWCWQRKKRGESDESIVGSLAAVPWKHIWWRKERVEMALVQMASSMFQRRKYHGWKTVLSLSGSNISAFLFIFSEIWDYLTKLEYSPIGLTYVNPTLQNDAISEASRRWLARDQPDKDGGEERYVALARLGTAIRNRVQQDKAMSNPGYTGFSLRDADLIGMKGAELKRFLNNGVKWAMLEVRTHRSKNRNDGPRHKWYLHPLLAPAFEIPYTRVKEPLYVNNIDVVDKWLFGGEQAIFSSDGNRKNSKDTNIETTTT